MEISRLGEIPFTETVLTENDIEQITTSAVIIISQNKEIRDKLENSLTEKFIPTTGGTITGAISSNVAGVLYRSNDTSFLQIHGANNYLSGAYLRLEGNNEGTSISGGMSIGVHDADGTGHYVNFYRNGRLTTDGKDIVRSVNGKAADISGNISLNTKYVELTKEEYTALAVKDSKTLYNVIDE